MAIISIIESRHPPVIHPKGVLGHSQFSTSLPLPGKAAPSPPASVATPPVCATAPTHNSIRKPFSLLYDSWEIFRLSFCEWDTIRHCTAKDAFLFIPGLSSSFCFAHFILCWKQLWPSLILYICFGDPSTSCSWVRLRHMRHFPNNPLNGVAGQAVHRRPQIQSHNLHKLMPEFKPLNWTFPHRPYPWDSFVGISKKSLEFANDSCFSYLALNIFTIPIFSLSFKRDPFDLAEGSVYYWQLSLLIFRVISNSFIINKRTRHIPNFFKKWWCLPVLGTVLSAL